MSAYVIVDIDIKDPALYDEYKRLTPPTISAYGGRYLARGGTTEKLEGDWSPKRLVILEFQDMDRARQWLDSPEYEPVKELRHRASRSNMIFVEGV